MGHWDTGDLGQERYSTGRTRVNFEYIYLVVHIDDELDIVQTDKAEAFTDACCIVDDRIFDFLADRLSRVDGDGVTGVDTGTFDMFHDTRNIDVLAIGDRIDFKFLTDDVFVDKDRGIVADFLNRIRHVDAVNTSRSRVSDFI